MNKLEQKFYDALTNSHEPIVSKEFYIAQAKSFAKICEEEIKKAAWEGVRLGQNSGFGTPITDDINKYMKTVYNIEPN